MILKYMLTNLIGAFSDGRQLGVPIQRWSYSIFLDGNILFPKKYYDFYIEQNTMIST